MKRCPQCEFIYEEEQSHCDMDGALLVHDPRALLDTARARSNHPHRSTRKLFVQLALPLAILASLSFYALRSQTPRHTSNPAAASRLNGSESASVGASASTSDTNSAGVGGSDAGTPVTNKSESSNGQDNQDQLKSVDPADNPNAQPNKENSAISSDPASSPSKRQVTRSQRRSPPKKENKVSSFLRKTGKFFKKPFER